MCVSVCVCVCAWRDINNLSVNRKSNKPIKITPFDRLHWSSPTRPLPLPMPSLVFFSCSCSSPLSLPFSLSLSLVPLAITRAALHCSRHRFVPVAVTNVKWHCNIDVRIHDAIVPVYVHMYVYLCVCACMCWHLSLCESHIGALEKQSANYVPSM